MARKRVALSLFWRTFLLLAILLGGGIFAWVQTLRALEFEPRAVQAAQQIASLVNLSRAALRTPTAINRVAMVKNLSTQEAIRIAPREPGDKWEPFEVDRFTRGGRRRTARPAGPRHHRRAQRQRPGGPVGGLRHREGRLVAADRTGPRAGS